jgi:hypothetical protein
MSRKEFLKIFHVTLWNIFNIFVCHVEIIYDMVEYSTPCHGIFCHFTSEICCGINNDLLVLNMDLANIVIENNIM